MKQLMPWLVVVAVILASTLPSAVLGEEQAKQAGEKPAEPAGKVLFVGYGCSECHTVLAAGISLPEEEAKAEEAEAVTEESEEEEMAPPDLSSVGLEHPAEWFRAYLDKKETLDGQKHMLRFRGTEDEWAALVGWLTTLRAAADTTAAAATEAAPVEKAPEKKSETAPSGESTN